MNLKWLIPCLTSSLLFASEITYPTQAQKPGELQPVPIEKDIEAARLAEATKQAKTGDPDAMARLGIMLLLGSEVERNLPEARVWLLRAAQKGQKDAQAKMGAMLFLGPILLEVLEICLNVVPGRHPSLGDSRPSEGSGELLKRTGQIDATPQHEHVIDMKGPKCPPHQGPGTGIELG